MKIYFVFSVRNVIKKAQYDIKFRKYIPHPLPKSISLVEKMNTTVGKNLIKDTKKYDKYKKYLYINEHFFISLS